MGGSAMPPLGLLAGTEEEVCAQALAQSVASVIVTDVERRNATPALYLAQRA